MPRSGASYSTEFEQREAAHWGRYKWEEFEDLDGERQSGVVAHYRAHHHLEAVIAHEQQKQANRRKK